MATSERPTSSPEKSSPPGTFPAPSSWQPFGVAASDHNTTATAASAVTVQSTGTGGGTLAPGDTGGSGLSTIGRFTISLRVFTLGSPSTVGMAHLSIELGGFTAGTQYDQIVIKGALSLADVTLDGSFVNGFFPAFGNEFFIITGATSAVTGALQQPTRPRRRLRRSSQGAHRRAGIRRLATKPMPGRGPSPEGQRPGDPRHCPGTGVCGVVVGGRPVAGREEEEEEVERFNKISLVSPLDSHVWFL